MSKAFSFPFPDLALLKTALACKCPKCGQGDLYRSRYSLSLNDRCAVCGFPAARNDSADGPAVFLIFILGFILVPLALLFDALVSPPLWVHAVLWGGLALGLTLGSLKPLKAYIIALQCKHRPSDWRED